MPVTFCNVCCKRIRSLRTQKLQNTAAGAEECEEYSHCPRPLLWSLPLLCLTTPECPFLKMRFGHNLVVVVAENNEIHRNRYSHPIAGKQESGRASITKNGIVTVQMLTPKHAATYPQPIICSWDHTSQFCVNKCPTNCNCTQSILSVNCSTCFGWFLHPTTGAQITVL